MGFSGFSKHLIIVAVGLLFILVNGCANRFGQPHTPPQVLVPKAEWPHEMSDLPADENTRFGRLANGLRYVLKENRTPPDRVSMHLYVQVGSLAEHDGEEGMAHFLEHMLFNGSTHFSPGELVKYFQRIGMQFGPDANARTGFAQTIYDIHLPKGDPDSIAEGLLVLDDFARGALLLPDQVAKEIPVVLAEKRSRDSARYRAMKAAFDFEMPGTLPVRRFPIGTVEAIQSFDEHSVRRFYEAWYRPERMFLVMVGDFDTPTARRLIEARFADMQPRAPAGSLPDFGRFDHTGVKIFHHFDKEIGATTVRIETIVQQPSPPDNTTRRRADLLEEIAHRMVQRRLDAMLRQPGSVMTSARIGAGDFLQQIRFAEISADTEAGDWDKALTAIEKVLRKALAHGFTAAELEREKRAYIAELQRAAAEENTLDSRELAQNIMSSLGRRQVHQSDRQRNALLAPMLEAVTLEQVHQAFTTAWSLPHRLVMVSGNADLSRGGQTPEEQILAVYHGSRQVPVAPPPERADAVFPYLPDPAEPGRIMTRNHIADLGVERVIFANGLHLFLKQNDFRENEVLAALSFGRGRSAEPEALPGLARMTEAVLNGSGFGAMDQTELQNALAGRLAEISLDVREDMFVVRGEAVPSELALLFQLFHTLLIDPGYRAEALHMARQRFEQHHRALQHSAEGLMQLQGQVFLAGGDTRFGWPDRHAIQAITLDHIQQWFGHPLAHAPLELVVVGDFSPDVVVDLAARYLGALPSRTEAIPAPERPHPVFPAGQSLRLTAATAMERALVLVGFPTADFWDIQRTRRLNLLSDLVSERLRVRIRETMGAAYSPFAYHRAHRAYPGYGMLITYLLVDPQLAEAMPNEVAEMAREMQQDGFGGDELRRALDPTLTQIKDLRQTNTYWLNSVLTGAARNPEQLDWARNMEADFAAISSTEMNALARQYLDHQKAATIVILPESN